MPRERVLFIAHDGGRTGATIGLLTFMRWLKANSDYEIATLLRSGGPLGDEFRALGPTLTLESQPRSRVGRLLHRLTGAGRSVDRRKVCGLFTRATFDLIYANTITNGGVLGDLPSGLPVLTHVHELEYWIWRYGPENLRRVLGRTTHFVAASEAVRHNLVSNHQVPGDRVEVIYEHIRDLPPVRTPAHRAQARALLGLPECAFVVGGSGAEYWRKGRDLVPHLLFALRRLRPRLPAHFVWVGRPGQNDEEFQLRYELRKTGFAGSFHTTQEVTNPLDYYEAFDAFALLSRDDPYPLVCLEAAGLGIPLVCFAEAGGMPEFCRDSCGLVAPYLDLDAFAAALVRLKEEPALATETARRARQKVASQNVIETTGPRLQAAMARALAAARS